jgi:NAD(P)-dependent dehydrogenase (short-subunit alcohol dehydrogenase family)
MLLALPGVVRLNRGMGGCLPGTGSLMASSRVVLVVGASSGIGRAVAQALARRGDDLVLAARSASTLEEAARECVAIGASSARAHVADVRDAEAVQSLVEGVVAEHGRLDAVVVTAAVLAHGPFEQVPAQVFEESVRTNVVGTANVARAALPVLRRQQGGTLVLTGSVLGHVAVPDMTPYVVSKWAVRGLARQLGLETRDAEGVHVCLVEPGAVDTPIYQQGANYTGKALRPPFPVGSPERVAARVVELLDQPRATASVGWANDVIRLGFRVMPFAYDRLVKPLFQLLGTTDDPVPPTTGNVLHPVPQRERLHGMAGA